jgi:hypothetical protein
MTKIPENACWRKLGRSLLDASGVLKGHVFRDESYPPLNVAAIVGHSLRDTVHTMS